MNSPIVRPIIIALTAAGLAACTSEPAVALRFGQVIECQFDSEGPADCEPVLLSTGSTGTSAASTADLPGPGLDLGSPGGGSMYDDSLGTTGAYVPADLGGGWPSTSTYSGGPESTSGASTYTGTYPGGSESTGAGSTYTGTYPGGSESTGGSDTSGESDTSGGPGDTSGGGGDTTSGAGETSGGPEGTSPGETSGGPWTGGVGDTGSGEGGDTGGPPAHACSNKCGFAVGAGLVAGAPADAPVSSVQGCAKDGPKMAPNKNIVGCLTNLACHLGRNPSKVEALQALGIDTNASMLGQNVICGTSSASAQPIPNATSDQPEGVRAMRCISSPFFAGAPWCSFTTLADDNTLECLSADFTKAPHQTCATDPVGIDLGELCAQIDATTQAPAGAAVFDTLVATATDDGPDSCSQCHQEMDHKSANGKACYFMPLPSALVVCPTDPLSAQCETEGATASCSDGKKPRCPARTTAGGQVPTCEDGKAPKCSQGDEVPKCQVEAGLFGASQSGAGTGFTTGMCTKLRQLAKNAKAAANVNGPPPAWTDMTFVDGYIAAFCPKVN